jgi:hypothetical protein
MPEQKNWPERNFKISKEADDRMIRVSRMPKGLIENKIRKTFISSLN